MYLATIHHWILLIKSRHLIWPDVCLHWTSDMYDFVGKLHEFFIGCQCWWFCLLLMVLPHSHPENWTLQKWRKWISWVFLRTCVRSLQICSYLWKQIKSAYLLKKWVLVFSVINPEGLFDLDWWSNTLMPIITELMCYFLIFKKHDLSSWCRQVSPLSSF